MACSPTSAKGVKKVVAYAKETVCWGEPALPNTAKVLRRVTSDFNLTKEKFTSNEIRESQQNIASRHGTRSATGSLNGELSAGSYSDFLQAIVARDFATVAPITGLSITIAASGDNYTVARSTGSWLTAGISPGMVGRLTAGTFNAANLNKNLSIISVNALTLTVKPVNGTTMVAEGPIASATFAISGKTTFVPQSNHTQDSFTFEERYTDINQYERYDGNIVNTVAVSLATNGFATIDVGFVGKDLGRAENTAYFTNPSAASSTGLFSAAQGSGVVMVNGEMAAVVTSADFEIARETENGTTLFSNGLSNIFTGKITATGNLNIYFVDGAYRDVFDDETEVSLVFTFAESTLANANCLSFVFPRVKFDGFQKADATAITVGIPFEALEGISTASGLPTTTVMIQDTSLV